MEGPYVINLDHRTDRWTAVSHEFAKIGIVPIRWSATLDSMRGFLGCLKSHVSILRHHFESTKPIWICEDDVEFLYGKETVEALIREFLTSPADVLCLGYSSYSQTPFNAIFHRTFSTQTTSSYILKSNMIKPLCLLYESVIDCIEKGTKHSDEAKYKTLVHVPDFYCADQCWKLLQQDHIWLIPIHHVVRQAESYSDIEKRVVFYGV